MKELGQATLNSNLHPPLLSPSLAEMLWLAQAMEIWASTHAKNEQVSGQKGSKTGFLQ